MDLLSVNKRLDIESQRRTDAHYIVTVQLFQDGRFASVIQSTANAAQIRVDDEERGQLTERGYAFPFLSACSF